MNGNAKGKVGERELAKVLAAHGYEARRAQQYCGAAGTEDIKHNIPGIYIECKRVEKLNVLKAYERAKEDSAGTGSVPTVMHRCNRSPWLVTLSLKDFLSLLRVGDELDTIAAQISDVIR